MEEKSRTGNISAAENTQTARKKKKKGKGWLVFLIVLASLAALFFGIRGIRKLLNNRLANRLPVIPFEFAEGDDSGYVTQDFTAVATMEDGKENTVCWTSSDEALIAVGENGRCEVSRPEEQNTTVVMTASEKVLFVLTAKAEYELTVICTDSLSPEKVYVPDSETIKNGKGRYAFTVYYTDDDKPYWISGKLGTRVGSREDAEAVAIAYRDFFGMPDAIELRYSDMAGDSDRIYTFDEYYQGVCLDGNAVSVTADENGILTGVAVSLPDTLPEGGGRQLSEKEQDELLVARYGDFVCFSREYTIWEGTYVWQIGIAAGTELLQVEMDAETGEILSEESLFSDAAEVEVSGTDSLGNRLTMMVTKPSGMERQLRDKRRQIFVYRLSSWLDESMRKSSGEEKEEDPPEETPEKEPAEETEEYNNGALSTWQMLFYNLGLSKYELRDRTVESSQALSAVYNLQKTYDWYLNEFGWKGVNGTGGMMYVIIDYPGKENNAAHAKLYKDINVFFTGADTSEEITGEFCAYPDVMTHEYTHGRFAEFNRAGKSNNEVLSIDESYADIFGAFMDGSWNMADGSIHGAAVRDFDVMAVYPGTAKEIKCPLNYDEIDFIHGDCHLNGMLLTRCAMEMETEGIVTREENKKIWYKAITYGNINNSCTFVTMRENVQKAALDLGLEQETADAIGEIFAGHKIGESKKKPVENGTVKGDALLDDTQKHRYMTLWSPFGTVLFGTPIAILEENTKLTSSVTDDELSERIGRALAAQVSDGSAGWAADHMKNVQYTRTGGFVIDYIYDVFDGEKAKITATISDATGDSSRADEMGEMIFQCVVYECTPYEFYTEVLGIDPRSLK